MSFPAPISKYGSLAPSAAEMGDGWQIQFFAAIVSFNFALNARELKVQAGPEPGPAASFFVRSLVYIVGLGIQGWVLVTQRRRDRHFMTDLQEAQSDLRSSLQDLQPDGAPLESKTLVEVFRPIVALLEQWRAVRPEAEPVLEEARQILPALADESDGTALARARTFLSHAGVFGALPDGGLSSDRDRH